MWKNDDEQPRVFDDNRRSNSNLRTLITRANLHLDAEKSVVQAIPPELREGTRFVSCEEGQLVLATDTAGKATRLRFRQHEIMEAIRENELFRFVWKVTIKVAPARYKPTTKKEKSPLTKENARLLKEEAGHTKDRALREVLEKLASHVER